MKWCSDDGVDDPAQVVVVEFLRRTSPLCRSSTDWSSSRFSRRSTDHTCHPLVCSTTHLANGTKYPAPAEVPGSQHQDVLGLRRADLDHADLVEFRGVSGAAKPGYTALLTLALSALADDTTATDVSKTATPASARRIPPPLIKSIPFSLGIPFSLIDRSGHAAPAASAFGHAPWTCPATPKRALPNDRTEVKTRCVCKPERLQIATNLATWLLARRALATSNLQATDSVPQTAASTALGPPARPGTTLAKGTTRRRRYASEARDVLEILENLVRARPFATAVR